MSLYNPNILRLIFVLDMLLLNGIFSGGGVGGGLQADRLFDFLP